ncbi:unnamed protein product [Microthlaspi erraticum]|uniref:Uncharacterized protein n=1 Tax=Microthlaspi erraticum TaxID=1685480 RepID=A0A6D2L3F8_9BRAS|nr:unnamed protein product [Microthlaspi erraticum]
MSISGIKVWVLSLFSGCMARVGSFIHRMFGLVVKWGGFTSHYYTNAQFEIVFTKMNALAAAVFTILMVFFMVDAPELLHTKHGLKMVLLEIVEISSMSYVVFSIADAILRPKFPAITIFGELTILSAFTCLPSLLAVLSVKTSLKFWVISFVTMYFLHLSVHLHSKTEANNQIRDENARNLVNALANSDSPAAANAVTAIALYAALFHPEDPNTKILGEIARQINPARA